MIEQGLVKKLTKFISNTVKAAGFSKVIIGLSGGLDSTVVAYLCVKSLGKKNVIGVIMPYGKLSIRPVRDAAHIAKILGIKAIRIDITGAINSYFAKEKGASRTRRGNKMARERMAILYDLSKKYKALVVGTSNRTERLLGYGTIYGDMACALNPIGGLYKTQVKAVAQYLRVPEDIIDKAPTAGLWPGQTDEGEIGYRYADIDRLLCLMVDKNFTDKKLINRGFTRRFISNIRRRMETNRFKLAPPVIAEIRITRSNR